MDIVDQILGNYRIQGLLGVGGMQQFFRGRHLHLDRSAATKAMWLRKLMG